MAEKVPLLRSGRAIRHALGAALLFAAAPLMADWSQWGGPQRDFKVPDAGLARQWGENGPPEVWSRPLGAGFSAPVVRGDTLYVHYRQRGSDGQADVRETVAALSAADGQTLWTFSYEAPAYPDQEQFGGGTGPHATPLVGAERVYTVGYSGLLHCLERGSGALLWSHDLVGDLGAEPVQFGFAASPLLHPTAGLLVPASGEQGGLAAFDPLDGRLRWHSGPASFSYASPVPVRVGGEEQVVLVTGDRIEGIAADDGRLRWSHDWPEKGLTNVPTPLWLDGEYLLVAGQGAGGALLLRLKGPELVEEVWKTPRMSYFYSNAVRVGDLVLAGDNFLYGVDWRSGKRQWAARGYSHTNTILAGDLLLMLDDAGTLTLAEPGQKGPDVLARTQLFSGNTWTVPALDGTRLYARNGEILVALDLGAGASQEQGLSARQARMGIGRAFRAGGAGALVAYVGEIRAQMPAALDAAALHRFAGVLGGEGRFADAVEVLQAAVQLFGTSVDGLGLLARARLMAGDQAGAVAAWRGVLDLQPDEEDAKAFLRQLDPAAPPTGNAAFVLEGRPEARTVTLAGSFNGWDREHTFFRREAGRWICRLQLPPGEYQYKIVVDGEEWMLDPGNPQTIDDGNGNTNSLIVIDQ